MLGSEFLRSIDDLLLLAVWVENAIELVFLNGRVIESLFLYGMYLLLLQVIIILVVHMILRHVA